MQQYIGGNDVHCVVGMVSNVDPDLARIIHVSEDKESLICYKHVVETVFEAANEASECLTIAQHSVCCSPVFFASQ